MDQIFPHVDPHCGIIACLTQCLPYCSGLNIEIYVLIIFSLVTSKSWPQSHTATFPSVSSSQIKFSVRAAAGGPGFVFSVAGRVHSIITNCVTPC